jgi:hypothetical protein
LFEGVVLAGLIAVAYIWISTAPRLVGVMKEAFVGTRTSEESFRG